MSINWMADIATMHQKFGVKQAVAEFDKEKLTKFLEFRTSFLQEELDEMKSAKTADDVVDALIDLCVVAIGTLDAFNVNMIEAWNRVHEANMAKEVGIKASRPNPLGLPDLIKPEGWEAPIHFDNVGLLSVVYEADTVVETPVAQEVVVEETPVVEETEEILDLEEATDEVIDLQEESKE